MTQAMLYICGAIITVFLLLIVQTFTIAMISWRWGFLPPAVKKHTLLRIEEIINEHNYKAESDNDYLDNNLYGDFHYTDTD
jgi:hypothetical protein